MGNEFGCAYQLPTDYKRRNQPDMIQLDTQLLALAPDVGAKANDFWLENRGQESGVRSQELGVRREEFSSPSSDC